MERLGFEWVAQGKNQMQATQKKINMSKNKRLSFVWVAQAKDLVWATQKNNICQK